MTAEKIIEIVCGVCGIEPGDLKQRSRKEPLPTARALIAHYLYRELRMFPRDILPWIGYPVRGRTSVYHYIPGRHTLVEQRALYDRDLRHHLADIDSKLEQLKA